MFAKVKKLVGGSDPDWPPPSLKDGEELIRQGVAAASGGLFGKRWGPILLTNHRLIWYETAMVIWPLKRISGEVKLRDIASVDKGNLLNLIFGGRCIRLRLRDGKYKCLYEGDGKLDQWISTIRGLIPVGESGARRSC